MSLTCSYLCPVSYSSHLVTFEFPMHVLLGVVKESRLEPEQLYYIELLDGTVSIKL